MSKVLNFINKYFIAPFVCGWTGFLIFVGILVVFISLLQMGVGGRGEGNLLAWVGIFARGFVYLIATLFYEDITYYDVSFIYFFIFYGLLFFLVAQIFCGKKRRYKLKNKMLSQETNMLKKFWDSLDKPPRDPSNDERK